MQEPEEKNDNVCQEPEEKNDDVCQEPEEKKDNTRVKRERKKDNKRVKAEEEIENKFQGLEEKFGYTFQNPKYLEQALTHSSETPDIHRNYERLEFLGDRILGVTIADVLCRTFPDEPEGSLAQRFVGLVCKYTVADVMKELDLPKYIIAGAPDVRRRVNVLCDIGEAVIAAIYLDSGEMAVAQDFVRRHWGHLIDRKSQPRKDYKTALQERASVLKLDIPVYHLVQQKGPAHAPEFWVTVSIGDSYCVEGYGKSKKRAEQEAAAKLLEELEHK